MVTRTIRRVHFVEYNAKINTLAAQPIFPKYGTPLLAAILKERGFDVQIFLEGVSDMDFARLSECDLVCLPVFGPAMNKIRAFVRRLRAERPELPIIMGGPHVCLFPESVLDICDYAVRCEGDEALPELIACLQQGGDVRQVHGISFRDGQQPVHTPDRVPPVIPATIPDLTLIEGFHRVRRRLGPRAVVSTLQTSRGCNFKCRFCPTSKLFGGVYRNRDIDAIIADVRSKLAYNRMFFVVDNSFLSNRARTIELLNRLIQENMGAHFIIFERHEIGRDTEMLQLMRKAGVRCIIVGIESLVDENLQLYDKRQSSRAVIDSVNNILRNDIHVIGTFVLGGDADTAERSQQIVDFVRTTGISLNLFIMHDLEEDESRGLMIPLNRRFQTYYQRTDPANTDFYDYFTGSFVTYFPKRMKPSTLQQRIVNIYEQVFTHGSALRRVGSKNLFAALFGVFHGYASMRTSHIMRQILDGYYLDFLRHIEAGLYDENEVLQEDRLAAIQSLPIPRPLEEHVDMRSYNGMIGLLVVPGLIRYGWRRLRLRCMGYRI